jgi:hypothetical protein
MRVAQIFDFGVTRIINDYTDLDEDVVSVVMCWFGKSSQKFPSEMRGLRGYCGFDN